MSEEDKPEYLRLVEICDSIGKEYKELEDKLLSGEIITEIMSTCDGYVEKAKEEFALFMNLLRSKVTEYNSAILAAQNALRPLVQLGPSQQRGPNGKSSSMTVGEFTVNSVTGRSFDGVELVRMAEKLGILDELKGIKKTLPSGDTINIIRHEVMVDYEGVMAFLQARNLMGIINAAYDEKEKTPQVKGPKPIAFLGERKDK